MGDIKILIAEDEAIAAEDLNRSLESLGYHVAAITSTAEDTIKNAQSLSPDLILMDIRLYGKRSGIDAAQVIQNQYNIPVVFLTAYADNDTLQKAKDSSPYGFILKPFQIRELIGVIETTLHRHKLEMDIKAKQAWLSTALNSIGDGVISTDLHSIITFMNPVAENLTGWTQQEALGKELKDIFHIVNEKTKKTVESPVNKVLREGRIAGLANHTLLIHKDGHAIPIDDSGSPIRNERGEITGVILVFKDISERKKAETGLRHMMERYRSLVDSNHNAIYLLDTKLHYLLMNQAYLSRLGLADEKSIIGKAYSKYHSIKNTRQFSKRIQSVILSGRPVNYEYQSDRDGRYFLRTLNPIRDDEAGSILAITVISTDISVQKAAEESLMISEERFRTIFENSPLGIAVLSNAKFNDVNSAFCDMLGYAKNELIHVDVSAITHPDDVEKDNESINDLFSGTTNSFQREKRYLKKSGEIVWARTTVTLIKTEEDDSRYTLAIIENISEKRETEEALKKSEAKYAAVFKSSEDGLIYLNPKGIVQDVNLAFSRITNIKRDEILGKHAEQLAKKLAKPEDLPGILKKIVSFFAGNIFAPHELEYENKTLELQPAIEPETAAYILAIRDITDQKHASRIQSVLFHISQATNQSENLDSLLKTIHKQLGQLINTKNFLVALYDTAAGRYSFPFMADEHKQTDPFDEQELNHSLVEYVRRTGSPLLADKKAVQNLAAKGEVKLAGKPSALWMGVPLKTAQKTFGVVVVQSYHDLTLYSEKDLEVMAFISEHIAIAIERKQAEDQIRSSLKEKEVLLREIHHRVKNNLQIIQSLLGLQTSFMRHKEDLKLIKESQDRVRSIALVHENLYQSPNLAEIDFAKYIQDLTCALYRSYKVDFDQIRLEIHIKNIKFPVDRAVPCGLIVNELLTNALKYAFPPALKRKGLIQIKMKRSGSNDVELIFSDNGVGIPDQTGRDSDSLGLKLVKLLVEEQLKGKMEVEYKKGTKYRITLNCPS